MPKQPGLLAHLIRPGYDPRRFIYRRTRDGRVFRQVSEVLAQLRAGEEFTADARKPSALAGLVKRSAIW